VTNFPATRAFDGAFVIVAVPILFVCAVILLPLFFVAGVVDRIKTRRKP
jgi:hypothetical protein